eukprot:4985599-Amphidinium_carterae.1
MALTAVSNNCFLCLALAFGLSSAVGRGIPAVDVTAWLGLVRLFRLSLFRVVSGTICVCCARLQC